MFDELPYQNWLPKKFGEWIDSSENLVVVICQIRQTFRPAKHSHYLVNHEYLIMKNMKI